MKSFEIDWAVDALDELGNLYMKKVADRNAITKAAFQIESMLERDPISSSKNLSEGLRKIAFKPLAAFFSLEGKKVEISFLRWVDSFMLRSPLLLD